MDQKEFWHRDSCLTSFLISLPLPATGWPVFRNTRANLVNCGMLSPPSWGWIEWRSSKGSICTKSSGLFRSEDWNHPSIHGWLAALHETSSGHLGIQRLPGADPGWGPSAHSVVKVQIMFLGPNSYKHPQGSTAGAATIHHCDVQQIPPRGSPSNFPEVCDPFTNCQEDRTGCWRRSKLSTDIQLDVHVEAYRENGISAAHSLPRNAQHASETSIRLPCSSFDRNSRSHGHLWYPRCCWPKLRGLARSPRHVGHVQHGWSWYLAGAAGNISRDGRHGFGMATIIPHRPIAQVSFQWGPFLNRHDHYRRTARKCPWTVTVLALLIGRTTNRQPAWSRYPLLCWWWTNLRLRKGRSSRWDDQ